MIPGSSFFGWQEGANRDAAEEAIRTGNPVKLGFLEKLYGGTTQDAQNIVNKQQQNALNTKYGAQLAELGLMADWGETEQQLLGKMSKRSQERKAGQVAKQRSELKADRQWLADRDDSRFATELQANRETQAAGLEQTRLNNIANLTAQRENNEANRRANQEQFAFTTKIEGMRNAHAASESQKERALTRDLSNNSNDLQMQMAFMDAELQDKRMEYDRETRRLDKRDRMIAQLMSGIGQLGGAFAI